MTGICKCRPTTHGGSRHRRGSPKNLGIWLCDQCVILEPVSAGTLPEGLDPLRGPTSSTAWATLQPLEDGEALSSSLAGGADAVRRSGPSPLLFQTPPTSLGGDQRIWVITPGPTISKPTAPRIQGQEAHEDDAGVGFLHVPCPVSQHI